MCKTHSGKFLCGHKVVDVRTGCPTPRKCKTFLKKQYTIPEKCTNCKHGTKDVERDMLAMKKRRTVIMSHEKVETVDGPRECEIEVVPCTGGMEINYGLNDNKKKKKKKESDGSSGSGGSSGKFSSMGSLGGTSSEGSLGKEPQKEKCGIM
ncbi:hypothetical protein AOL_s00110g292 [Orbilia oligospora ATCC 24927]|uniref:Uncharacterized protein n=2 Tax=Orbilia oligospora TaxID=2813651 RepID=G1XLC2_ARTOA|nr:hypothetical protein AOL_s00110g292 [Orbilia oligospora ATCC 24927]EGX46128.1 hypothetical protein AOL_s00110g292 [Orbilia oligospora ATCC 24927]KAF3271904.1 hypothetical protein TWF970_010201 [Orbilia oligospora]